MNKPKLIMADVTKLELSPDHLRIVSDDQAELDEDGLLTSIKTPTVGVIQPLQVRNHPSRPDWKQILAGQRRFRCCQVLGLATVMALDYGALSDHDAFQITVIENAHRRDLKPLEQGKAASLAMAKCNGDVKAAAALLGQSPRWIAMGAKIHDGLTKPWQNALVKEPTFKHWTAGHVVCIARFPAGVQKELLTYFTTRLSWKAKDMTVDQLAAETAEFLRELAKAPFATESCTHCPQRSDREPLLWADDPSQAEGAHARCLDAACWRAKEIKAVRAAFARKAATHKGLVAIDLRKSVDYHDRVELKELYGAAMLTDSSGCTPEIEIVAEGTEGAVPALVVAGVGKGSVKYIHQVKRPSSRQSNPRKSKAETEAAYQAASHQKAIIAALRKKVEAVTIEQILHELPYFNGMVFCCFFNGCYGELLYGKEKRDFIKVLQTFVDDEEELRTFLVDRLWTETKRILLLRQFDLSACDKKDHEKTLRAIAHVFGWGYEGLVNQAEADLAAAEDMRKRTEIVKVELPKKLKAACEIRLLEHEDKWYGGFALTLPEAVCDLPVALDSEAYGDKACCCLEMAAAAIRWLTEEKAQKRCPDTLYKPIAAAIADVTAACKLQLARSDTAAAAAQEAEPLAWDLRRAKRGGRIEHDERIRVELPAAAKASITIMVAELAGRWYIGYDCHVPGAGHYKPCSTAHCDYAARLDALAAVRTEIDAWLVGKPGKRGYKHYGAVREAVALALAPTVSMPAAPDSVMR